MPRFLERDEAEREPPCEKYPWDGVSGVRPFSRFATTVVEGVQDQGSGSGFRFRGHGCAQAGRSAEAVRDRAAAAIDCRAGAHTLNPDLEEPCCTYQSSARACPIAASTSARVPHYRTREPFVEISQANAGLIRRDLLPERQQAARDALRGDPGSAVCSTCARAPPSIFEHDTLPLGDAAQSRRTTTSSS